MVILLIDDSSTMRAMYKKTFLKLYLDSLQIHQAANGQEGLDILESVKDIDMIILDINMPIMNGIEFLKKLRSENAYNKIKVIISSSTANREFVQKMFAEGANSFIVKPFTAEKAKKAIDFAYKKKSAR